MALNGKGYFRTLGFADPVALHILDALAPVQLLQVFQQALCISGNFQHPLTHRTTDNRVPSALAEAVNNFFVGQYSTRAGHQLTGTSAT